MRDDLSIDGIDDFISRMEDAVVRDEPGQPNSRETTPRPKVLTSYSIGLGSAELPKSGYSALQRVTASTNACTSPRSPPP